MSPQVPPPDSSDSPITDNVLSDELSLAREHGLNDPNHPLPSLLAVARVLSSKSTDPEKIEDAVTQAIGCLGGKDADALMALMGFTHDTRGLRVKPRREKAAELAGHITYEGFRTRRERALLPAVAGHLSGLVRERRMADRIASFETASDTQRSVSASMLTSSDNNATVIPTVEEEANGDQEESQVVMPSLVEHHRIPWSTSRLMPIAFVVSLIVAVSTLSSPFGLVVTLLGPARL